MKPYPNTLAAPTSPVLQLEGFEILALKIDWLPIGDNGPQSLNCRQRFAYDIFRHAENPSRYRLVFRVEIDHVNEKGETCGYQIESSIAGNFSFPEGFAEEHRPIAIRKNGVSLLYSTLRGNLSLSTGSFPGGPFILPSINPDVIVKLVEEGRKKKVSKSRKKPVSVPATEKD